MFEIRNNHKINLPNGLIIGKTYQAYRFNLNGSIKKERGDFKLVSCEDLPNNYLNVSFEFITKKDTKTEFSIIVKKGVKIKTNIMDTNVIIIQEK